MTKKDLLKAEGFLLPHADRLQRAGLDSGHWALTVFWRNGGGQSIFYDLREVEARVEGIEARGSMTKFEGQG